MLHELERVALAVDMPDHHLIAGDAGTVVDVTSDGEAVTVEFLTPDGKTLAAIPLNKTQVRHVGSREIAHARVVEA